LFGYLFFARTPVLNVAREWELGAILIEAGRSVNERVTVFLGLAHLRCTALIMEMIQRTSLRLLCSYGEIPEGPEPTIVPLDPP
jgi:hypothetical protein